MVLHLLWAVASIVAVRGVRTLYDSPSAAASAVRPLDSAVELPPAWSADSVAHRVRQILAGNVFRQSRTADGPAPAPPPPPVPEPPLVVAPRARPMPTLKGIIGGNGQWEAVLAGVRGRQSSVLVRPRDTVDGMRVRDIGATWIVLVESDSTLRLTLRAPHQ